MSDDNKILDAAKVEKVAEEKPAQKKRGRGRPKKVDAEALRIQEEQARAKLQEEKLKHWESVVETLLTTVSMAIEQKFPKCGPTQQEIQTVKPSAAWLLDHYLPDEDERTVHWGNLIMGLGLPTFLKILNHKRQENEAIRAVSNGELVNGTEAKKEKV